MKKCFLCKGEENGKCFTHGISVCENCYPACKSCNSPKCPKCWGGKNVQDVEDGYVNSAQKNLKKSLISNMLSFATIVFLKDLKKSEEKKKKEDKEK
jgi:hypothetical protein